MSPELLSIIDSKSFSDASNQTIYASSDRLINNLRRKCEEINRNFNLGSKAIYKNNTNYKKVYINEPSTSTKDQRFKSLQNANSDTKPSHPVPKQQQTAETNDISLKFSKPVHEKHAENIAHQHIKVKETSPTCDVGVKSLQNAISDTKLSKPVHKKHAENTVYQQIQVKDKSSSNIFCTNLKSTTEINKKTSQQDVEYQRAINKIKVNSDKVTTYEKSTYTDPNDNIKIKKTSETMLEIHVRITQDEFTSTEPTIRLMNTKNAFTNTAIIQSASTHINSDEDMSEILNSILYNTTKTSLPLVSISESFINLATLNKEVQVPSKEKVIDSKRNAVKAQHTSFKSVNISKIPIPIHSTYETNSEDGVCCNCPENMKPGALDQLIPNKIKNKTEKMKNKTKYSSPKRKTCCATVCRPRKPKINEVVDLMYDRRRTANVYTTKEFSSSDLPESVNTGVAGQLIQKKIKSEETENSKQKSNVNEDIDSIYSSECECQSNSGYGQAIASSTKKNLTSECKCFGSVKNETKIAKHKTNVSSTKCKNCCGKLFSSSKPVNLCKTVVDDMCKCQSKSGYAQAEANRNKLNITSGNFSDWLLTNATGRNLTTHDNNNPKNNESYKNEKNIKNKSIVTQISKTGSDENVSNKQHNETTLSSNYSNQSSGELQHTNSDDYATFLIGSPITSSKDNLSISNAADSSHIILEAANNSNKKQDKNRHTQFSYNMRCSEINFKAMQHNIVEKRIFEDGAGILMMHQHIVELIEEVFEKDKQITYMHDLLSITSKSLLLVFKSLNVLEKKTTRINLQDLNSKIRELEDENEDLQKAVKNTTEELEKLDKLSKDYYLEKDKLQCCCQEYEIKISLLQAEQEQERSKLKECCRQFEEQISILENEKEQERSKLKECCRQFEEQISILENEKDQECSNLKDCCRQFEEQISIIQNEQDQERSKLKDCCGQFEEQISILENEKHKLMEQFKCCNEDYISKEKNYVDRYTALQDMQENNIDTIYNLENELIKVNNINKNHCCAIQSMEITIQKLSAQCCKPPTRSVGIETYELKKANKCQNTATCNCSNKSTQSRAVTFPDQSDDYYDIQVVKPVPATFSSRSSTSGSEIRNKHVDLLEVTFSDLKHNVGRFIEKDYVAEDARKRIAELEDELQQIRVKNEIIDIQNNTLNIVENELQAWRQKEKEVECARCCREQEIFNLKEVINSLMKSLDNERQRSENLQKAVDLYLNSINVLQESEEQYKKEMSDQRATISNLQDALVATKHSLEKNLQKANQDYVNMTQVIEKLRDENLILEVDLFYYFQDIEMYEMRVLKYQQLLRDLQGQCYKIHDEVQLLQNHKLQQSAFVDDLSEQLSECQDELRHLFKVLTEEQNLVENESMTLTNHIMALQTEMCALSQKLAVTLQCLENEKKNNNVLEYQLNIRAHESSCLTNEVFVMRDKLRLAANEIISHQSTIITLQNKLHDYEKSITLLDEESELCQNNIQFCFKNLKDAQINLEKKNKDYDVLNIQYANEIGTAKNLRLELQKCHAVYNDELNKCQQTISKLQTELDNKNSQHNQEIDEYIQTVHNLQEKLKEAEIKYKTIEEELSVAHEKLLDGSENEMKLKRNQLEIVTELNGKVNAYINEQNRLMSVINNLKDQLSALKTEISRKDDEIESLKLNLAGNQNTNREQKQMYQEEICNLKNEINTLIQERGLLQSENDKLQMQVSKFHNIISKNDEKGKLMVQELKQCLTELQTIQGDKEFLLQKNEQLAHEIQSLQDACQSKTESVVTLEMELNDTKCIRDTLCNESRNVINNVKAWLQEQRKINVELNNKIKQKNILISQMNQEKIILRNKIKQMSCACTQGQGRKNRTATLSCRPQTPPLSGPSWTSYGSTESASCSSDSELDGNDHKLATPQVWIHRVESLTEKLQRKNCYWRNKMDEHDFVVSKDK